MGIGMVGFVEERELDTVMESLHGAGEDPRVIGETLPGSGMSRWRA